MTSATQVHSFTVRLAADRADRIAVQRLRYDIFVKEQGADGPDVDHATGQETDLYDKHADHLLLIDPSRPENDQIVGTYRLMTRNHAAAAGGFYSATEYDLARLYQQPGNILELGRSCLDKDYRGGTALLHLWRGLGHYVTDHNIDLLFGVASFKGTDTTALAQPLSLLHADHLAADELRVAAIGPTATALNILPTDQLDRRTAMTAMPALIKAYLRVGGVVGDGAFVDHAFNTTDVCMILDAAKMTDRQRALYGAPTNAG